MNSSPSVTKTICGIETQVVVHTYADRVLLLVTQLGKVGHLLQVSIPPTAPLLEPNADLVNNPLVEIPPSVTVTPLFGGAPSEHIATLHSLYASQIAMLVWTFAFQSGMLDRTSVVVGLALKKTPEGEDTFAHEQTTFKGVMQMIVELCQQKAV